MMEFNGTFEIEGVTSEEVWLALSDPILLRNAAPGCQVLHKVEGDTVDFASLRDDTDASSEDLPTLPEADPEEIADRAFEAGDRYAALVEISVGSVKPSFESVVTIDEKSFPTMRASGEGNDPSSSFEMESWMTLEDTEDGVQITWGAEADVFGRIAQMGQRVVNPVAHRVANQFFANVEAEISDIDTASDSLRDRIRNFI